jgi:Tc toxin complex TcA C-terminal TcB-binding domain/ABC toxin N-terminal region/Neuraminidase-like domain/Salmonella virulence plasmid 28.1kDa A protein
MEESRRKFEVHGKVTGKHNHPIERAKVVVWRQQIRNRIELAAGETSEDGRYHINYDEPEKAPEKLLIVVEALSEFFEKPLYSAVTPAQADQQIDLSLEQPDDSEWGTLVRGITPLLEGLALGDLVENSSHQDISFLAQELNQSTEAMMRIAVSARLEAAFKIPAAAFYAFLRQRVPAALPSPLVDASQNFTLIDPLVQNIGSLIFTLSADVQRRTLTAAVALNYIGQQFTAQIQQLVEELQAQRATNLLNQPFLVGSATLGQLLNVASLPEARQQAFSQALATNTLSMRNFWRTLADGKHGVSASEASSIERILSVGAFVKNYVPLVQTLLDAFAKGTYKGLPDLARLSLADWEKLVEQAGPPPGINAAGNLTAAQVFARVVYTRVTRAYPTAALSGRITAANLVPQNQQSPLLLFFQNNPELELTKTNIPAYMTAQGEKAFTGISQNDRAAVIANARSFQRVLRIAPNPDISQTLLGLGVKSATQIAVMGNQQFFSKATDAGLTKTEANHTFRVAAQRYASTVALFMRLNTGANGIVPQGIGQAANLSQLTQQAIQRDQSLATLFGTVDYCATDDCTSVLSPAAYLADLLLWLRNHPQAGGKTALDFLDDRRPDIRHLLLNCPNSDTELPYIDLVNEILADKISPPADPNSKINPPWKQTSASVTEQELRAAPEYFNQAAYVILFNASYPQTLPYSAGLDELRTYVGQSNIPLWQIRKALLPLNAPTTAQQAAVAAERFWLNVQAANLITTPNFVAAAIAWNTSDFSAAAGTGLATVPVFLQASKLTYEQLLELLQVTWVQGGLGITIQGIDDTCNTQIQALTPAPLDPGFLDRAHRFLRLWLATGLKMWELDLLLAAPAVGNGTLDQNALIALLSFQQLKDATRLAVDRRLAFFQNIDTVSHRDPDGSDTVPLYNQIFLNAAVTSVAPDPDLAALVSGGPIANPVLSAHVAAIQAALSVSAADAATLFSLTNNTLTLANLSLIYRVNALAVASKFSIADLLSVAALLNPTAPNPAAAVAPLLASPAATLAFLNTSKSIQQSSLSIDALTYLMTPPSVAISGGWATASQMTQADIATALTSVQSAALNPTAGNLNGSVIAAMAANAHTSTGSGIANDVTALILNNVNLPGTAQTLLAVLTDPAFVNSTNPINAANFPNQFTAVQLFDKLAVLVRGLRLVASDLGWLLANAAVYGGLDLTQLPVTAAQLAIALAPLLNMLLVIKLARLWTAAPPASPIQTLYDVIGGVKSGALVNEPAAQAALATITGWPLADITSFATVLGVTFPAQYLNPATYDSLRTLEAMANTASASGAQIVSWGSVPADEPTAESLAADALGALKAQHPSNDAWLSLAPTLMNPIREHRSAALQAYLVGQRDGAGNLIYGDADGLFGYFLIDVQMTSCQVTSRVVQAYIAIQIFVERCLMNLEAPSVVVNLVADDTWAQWDWMSRYRVWEANREVFLYPENWLIESVRLNRTEIYKTFEQEVRQGQSTTDYLESVVLNYIDRLDGVAHLIVTGTCEDPATGSIYVVARAPEDPPVFYYRSYINSAWSGWIQVPLDIKAHQAVPAIYRGRLCLFWMQVALSNEPSQPTPAAQASSSPPKQDTDRYVSLGVFFSIFRNGSWSPAQAAKGKLFDKPFTDTTSSAINVSVVEALYSLKVQSPPPSPGYGAPLFLDVFRLGKFDVWNWGWLHNPNENVITGVDDSVAVHLGRAVFDGRFSDLELRNMPVPLLSAPQNLIAPPGYEEGTSLLTHAHSTYGVDAQPLLPLPDNQADPDLPGEPGLVPQAGALLTVAPDPNGSAVQTQQLVFTSMSALEQNVGPLLNNAQIPFRVVGPSTDLAFHPSSDFFFQDNRRCYFAESTKYYWTGSMFWPVAPSDPESVPYEIRYYFHVFYHPFTRLFWNQLAAGGFDLLYDPNLQANPDQIDPSGSDVLSFVSTYHPFWLVNFDHDDVTGQDRQFLDFRYNASYSVYNWELFYHVPLYVAQLLSQNQQFEDARTWFQYIFNPTRQGSDPVPQRFWIPKPLHNLTSAQILQQEINNLLEQVNQGDPAAVAEVESWRNDPFNPFLIADQRPVAYMKSAVMSYLDNLIAWGDNLFSTESREALSEATLLYVLAQGILGPTPAAVTPPAHADQSYDQLEPLLDAFANAWVEIENSVGGSGGGSGGSGGSGGGPLPVPHTFYFKIPSNEKLLGYWSTVADRLSKLRHCQTIAGAPLALALFDAPIDPALLIQAQAAGMDLSSVLTAFSAPLPNYRFTALYSQALDFVNAVRAYGSSLQAALEKVDAGALSLLQQSTQQQLLADGDQVLAWQVQQAQSNVSAINASIDLAQKKYDFNNSQSINAAEFMGATLHTASGILKVISAATQTVGAVAAVLPNFTFGAAGFGGTPVATINDGGVHAAEAGHMVGLSMNVLADILEIGAGLCNTIGSWEHRQDGWDEARDEADIQRTQAQDQLAGAQFALQIAQQNVVLHQEQIDNIQKQIDFLNDKFTSNTLYDWMVSSLAATYFQSYQLAYQMCKQLEHCYQFELGLENTSFIQFGYWDSLHKGLLAGETLNHDLRRMQSSYLQQNARRFEMSRYVSLAALSPVAVQQLITTGACDFTLPELLFDNDYPGHYNRRLVRVSVTVVYPNPGKFDNIKGTLTLVSNQVRVNTDTAGGYAENPVGADPRFNYNYAAVPQKIVLGNAQDDPGLFITAISSNISDQRYLPFENAGAVSSWHFEMPQATNEVDLSGVGDVVFHLYYTALDGGDPLKAAAQANNAANLPTSGVKVFSALNDFAAPAPSAANPYPVSPWQAFLSAVTAPANQSLSLSISAAKFPPWTRGKTITVTSVTVLAVAWPPGNFVLAPQAPLPAAQLNMAPLAGVTEPNVCGATIAVPAGTKLGSWSFEIQKQGAADFRSLSKNDIGDVILLIDYQVS